MNRNSSAVAGMVAGLVVLAYLAGTYLLAPWGPALVAVLSGGGVTAPSVYRWIAQRGRREEVRDVSA